MAFQISDELIDQVQEHIAATQDSQLLELMSDFHYADIAEVLDALDLEDATYLLRLLDSETTSDALMELDEDLREDLLDKLSPKEIAEELEEMDTDDAADVIAELDDAIVEEVIDEIKDEKHANEIRELLSYDENSAGGLMAKELVRVKDTWTIAGCVREMRRQAKNVTRVHSIYVVGNERKTHWATFFKRSVDGSRKSQDQRYLYSQSRFCLCRSHRRRSGAYYEQIRPGSHSSGR